VLPEDDMRGRPVYAEMLSKGITQPLKSAVIENAKIEKAPFIFYRVPDRAELSIVDGGDVLARKSLPIHQFGSIIRFPLKYLQESDKFIEFLYPKEKE
jgi:hypothetical protein